jgi:hypothetical protein
MSLTSMARERNADQKHLSGFAVDHRDIPLRNVIVIVIVMLIGIQFGILCRGLWLFRVLEMWKFAPSRSIQPIFQTYL